MSERNPTTPQGRLNNFEKRKEAYAHKRYIDEVLGDAGVTDFSLEAKQKLEDLAEYDQYMRRFSNDQRDPLDRHMDAIDSGNMETREDKEAKNDPRLRRIAKLALAIEQMAADGSGQRVADKTGKTVLDYRMERLKELQDEYTSSATSESPAPAVNTPENKPASSETAPNTEPAPSADTDKATESTDKKSESSTENQAESTSENTADPAAEQQTAASEQQSDNDDPYQVGKTVRTKISNRVKDADGQMKSYAGLGFAKIIDRSEDGQTFTIEATVKSDENDTKKVDKKIRKTLTRKELEEARVVQIMEYARHDDGSLKRDDHSNRIPLGWQDWTIVDGPDEDGWMRVKRVDDDGKVETKVFHRNSLEMKIEDKMEEDSKPADKASEADKYPEKSSDAPTPEAVEEAKNFIGRAPKAAEKASPTFKPGKLSNAYPLGERSKRGAAKLEKLTGIPNLAAKLERNTAAIRRLYAESEVAAQVKSDREWWKKQLRNRFSRNESNVTTDRDTTSWIGKVTARKAKAPSREEAKRDNQKATRGLGKDLRKRQPSSSK